MTIRTLMLGAALGLSLVVLGARIEATPNEATIPLDDVAAVWVKEHDDSWLHYIGGAPDFVNERFVERYAPHLLATPTPEPTPSPPSEARGFSISGQGPGTHETEAAGELVCSAEVTGNVDITPRERLERAFDVIFSGTGHRKPAGRVGLERYRREILVDNRYIVAAEQTLRPLVIDFGNTDGEQAFYGPYTMQVEAAQAGRWTVRCSPVAPMPEASGFSLGEYGDSAGKAPHDHVLGEGIIDIAGDVAGLLSCWFELYAPRVGYSMSSILGSFQWAVWGRDDAGEPKAIVTTYSRGKRIWFGDERPGEYQAFNPPYGLEVWTLSTVRWAVSCEPVTP